MRVGEAAKRTGWSSRMLRYLETTGLVVPGRTKAGYRSYGLRELNQLRSLRDLRRRFSVEIGDVVFAARLRREPDLRAALDTWLHRSGLHAPHPEPRQHARARPRRARR